VIVMPWKFAKDTVKQWDGEDKRNPTLSLN
jgi:hypothetical protein